MDDAGRELLVVFGAVLIGAFSQDRRWFCLPFHRDVMLLILISNSIFQCMNLH